MDTIVFFMYFYLVAIWCRFAWTGVVLFCFLDLEGVVVVLDFFLRENIKLGGWRRESL